MTTKKFVCVWNEDIFEVHSLASLYDNYKRTNLYEQQFEDEFGDSINVLLDVMALNQTVTFDNMTVTRIR